MAHPFLPTYDVTLAALAKIMLLDERSYSLADCSKDIYEPTDNLIEQLALSDPKELKVIHSQVCHPKEPKNKKGQFVHLFLVCLSNKVVYLGTVLNASFAIAVHQFLLELKINKLQEAISSANWSDVQTQFGELQIVANNDPFSISRRFLRCAIPVVCEEIDPHTIAKGVSKFMRALFPSLCNLPVTFFSNAERDKLMDKIALKAKEIAKSFPAQTTQERSLITAQEYGI